MKVMVFVVDNLYKENTKGVRKNKKWVNTKSELISA